MHSVNNMHSGIEVLRFYAVISATKFSAGKSSYKNFNQL